MRSPCLLLLLCTVALGVSQRTVPRWTVRSSSAGTPGYRTGTRLGVRSSFNRVGSAPGAVTSFSSFSGGSNSGFNTFNNGNPLGGFFNTQLQNIQNSFSQGSSFSSSSSSFPSRGSSFPSRGSSFPSRGTSAVSRPSNSEDSDSSDD